MDDFKTVNQCGCELVTRLHLRTPPLAVKMIKSESEIPAGAVRPKRDRGYHLALCQAFTLARREGRTLALLKEDHWCWGPLYGYGLVDPGVISKYPQANMQAAVLPTLPFGRYIGTLCGPLNSVEFVPDVVLVYLNSAQLRECLKAVKLFLKENVHSLFDPFDSCVFSVVPSLLNSEFRITLPDPGESERAAVPDDEIIFSVPEAKLQPLVEGLRQLVNYALPAQMTDVAMLPDFPRPEFYDKLFADWGLDSSR